MIAAMAMAISMMLTPLSQAQDGLQDGADNAKAPIIVTPPKSEGERREELRDFTRAIVREPRRGHPIARFRYPICPKVLGISDPDARAIEERIRVNAEGIGIGANRDPDCLASVRIAFMSPAAGPPESWLDEQSPQLAHIRIGERRALLSEPDPVRAWNKVQVRDFRGNPIRVGEELAVLDVPPAHSRTPLVLTEITGAAVLIERESAEGMSLAQLADYITMRALVGTALPDPETEPTARTILSLFNSANPPEGLTDFDRSLLTGLYRATRNSTARRVIADTAAKTVHAERSGLD